MRPFLFFILLFSATTLLGQTKKFTGSWTKLHTTYQFDFDLLLKIDQANQVDGYFVWKVVAFDQHNATSKRYYKPKLGQTGTEFVRGIYDPSSRTYHLKGYKKDDPHQIIGLDTYQLKEDPTGIIEGETNANGSGLGRIKGRRELMEAL